MMDGKAFGTEVVTMVKGYMERALYPVLQRLDTLERQLASLPVPQNGKDADEDVIVARVSEKMAGELAAIRTEVDSIKPQVAASSIETVVRSVVAEIPAPQNGKDADEDAIMARVSEKMTGELAAIRSELEALGRRAAEHSIDDIVRLAVAEIPVPQDGKSVTPDDIRPLIEEAVSKTVASIPAPKDGCGIKNLLIDRDGALVATMEDGRMNNLGPVVGRDADTAPLERFIAEKIEALPKPADGKDGLGFDDLTVEHDGGRAFTFKFSRGERTRGFQFSLPVVLDCGVYKAGTEYEPGDGVTWAGSFWIAQERTSDKPDGGKSWRLAVKRGRDGKDAVK